MSIANALRPLILALAFLLSAPGAFAQLTASLPGSIVQSGSISGAARQQIQEYVDALSGPLNSDDVRDASRAREQLVRPLEDRDVSVAFRQAYSQSLATMLSAQSDSDDIQQQLLALRLAGELATSDALRVIRKHLSSGDNGVRLFAIGRVQRVFEMTAAHGPAISSTEAAELIRLVSEKGKKSADPIELDGIVRALAAGSALPGADMSRPRNQSIGAIEAVVSPILRGLKPSDDTESGYRLGLRAASAITASINDLNSTPDAASLKASIGLAGDILSVPLRQILAGQRLEGSERELTVRTVQSAEALLYFARRKQPGGGQVSQTGFAQMIQKKEDRDYRNAVSLLFDANSKLVSENGFAADRFVTK
ncbi:MAG: hypothetical protein KC996_03060 [Phycisphaerales bacterium]|nr:hypothetical protein [Phycisphaerales bacterium]